MTWYNDRLGNQRRYSPMTRILRHEDFTPHVDKSFRFDDWHGTLRLVRIETPQHATTPDSPRPPFTLIFVGPREDILPEGMRTATPEGGPSFQFYIMPIHTPAPGRQEYQAVFN